MSVLIDCSTAASPCTAPALVEGSIAICKDDSGCKCADAFPVPSGGTADKQCTQTGLTCAQLNEAACGLSSDCAFADGKCDCDPSKNLVAGTDGRCLCNIGYQVNASTSTCEACTGDEFNDQAGVACQKCSITGTTGAPANGTTAGNTHCVCTNTSQGIHSNACIACNGDGQTVSATNGSCICKENYTQNDDGTCKAASSASPLAILLICALIISVIASVATAAVVAKRKAAARRTAEVIVSDAL